MKSEAAAKYVSGVAVHWYADFIVPPLPLLNTHNAMPDKFLLATEACAGSLGIFSKPVILGSWDRFESYTKDIMEVCVKVCNFTSTTYSLKWYTTAET